LARIRYDANLIKSMSIFQSLTKSRLKDCIENEGMLTFIVDGNDIGKAIGKRGSNARMLENALNRKIKIVAFNPDVLQFVRNLVYPLKVADVSEEEGVVTVRAADRQTRGFLIGRNAKNLRNTESIVKRHFGINEIKVL